MTSPQSLIAHGAALALALFGLTLWDAQGAGIIRDAVFSFCL
ncbi:hypothetical protein [Aureimonas populi]|uniref:Uncharacterized protein n=1 Tax=Aureimonas populi TaxID=1701758 RepID=A0ABW5CS65_9HYPH|nr:hypothetical protein [Aureimonas populi]